MTLLLGSCYMQITHFNYFFISFLSPISRSQDRLITQAKQDDPSSFKYTLSASLHENLQEKHHVSSNFTWKANLKRNGSPDGQQPRLSGVPRSARAVHSSVSPASPGRSGSLGGHSHAASPRLGTSGLTSQAPKTQSPQGQCDHTPSAQQLAPASGWRDRLADSGDLEGGTEEGASLVLPPNQRSLFSMILARPSSLTPLPVPFKGPTLRGACKEGIKGSERAGPTGWGGSSGGGGGGGAKGAL